jgi:DNA-binding GntR family transcriptional regulator
MSWQAVRGLGLHLFGVKSLMATNPRDPATVDEDQTAKAYRSIRRMIVDGGLPPGHRMSHRTLAERLGIGRSPVRDAILQLEAEGLVVQRAQKGVLLRELTPRELSEVYELRLVMEPFFAERAALLADPTQVAGMREACERLAEIVARPDFEVWWRSGAENARLVYQLDMQLHSLILAAAGNTVATRIFSSAHVLAHAFSWSLGREADLPAADRLVITAAEHMGIYEAIRDRDPTAARERMRRHVLDAIPSVTARYALTVRAAEEAAEQAAAAKAAAAVRGRR